MPRNYTLLNRYSTYDKDYIKYFENVNDPRSYSINEVLKLKMLLQII